MDIKSKFEIGQEILVKILETKPAKIKEMLCYIYPDRVTAEARYSFTYKVEYEDGELDLLHEAYIFPISKGSCEVEGCDEGWGQDVLLCDSPLK